MVLETEEIPARDNQGFSSEPECSSILEERNKSAIDVACHDCFYATQELATNKDGRDRLLLAFARQLVKEGMDFTASRVAVDLHDGGADA